MKYRIVYNGHIYKAQMKPFLRSWMDLGGEYSRLEDAQHELSETKAFYKKVKLPWRTVHEEGG